MVHGAPALVLPVLDAVVVATVTPVEPDPRGVDRGPDTDPATATCWSPRCTPAPSTPRPAAVLPTVTAVTATLRHFGVTDRRFHVRVDSDVPTARGMGSSAAVAAAVTAAVADALVRPSTPTPTTS